jgi:nitric oxide reductase NorQ protein/cobaltochelatase CobS
MTDEADRPAGAEGRGGDGDGDGDGDGATERSGTPPGGGETGTTTGGDDAAVTGSDSDSTTRSTPGHERAPDSDAADGSDGGVGRSGRSFDGARVRPAGDPTGRTFGDLAVLEPTGHPKVPAVPESAYHHRALAGGKTDVEIVTRALQQRMNVVLKGPPGVGKSFLAQYLAAQTNRPLYRVTLSETTYREDLLGYVHLVTAASGDSVTTWVDGPLTRAVREGALLLLDEINAADSNTVAALNAVMEQHETRSLTIPQTGEVIDPHEQFRVIATANPGYQGTYELNDAFEDRFRHVKLDYLPPELEVELVFDRTDLDRSRRPDVEQLVSFAGRLRQAYRDGELTTPITTRELVRIAKFVEGGFMSLEAAARSELVARVDEHDESLVETLIDKDL